jgi:activator of 2-hydroxyglutaryl-CoA dehydratase
MPIGHLTSLEVDRMITAGIDCGAKDSETVFIQDRNIVGKGMVLNGFDPDKAVDRSQTIASQNAGISKKGVQKI